MLNAGHSDKGIRPEAWARSLIKGAPFPIVLILLLGVIAYSNTFGVPFVFDDIFNIVENPLIRDSSKIPSFFSGERGPFASRPLMHATLALNYHFGRLDTWGYHTVNLALHLVNGILLYILITAAGRHLGYDDKKIRLAAVFSTAIFVVHPIQTEAVTYIVSRSMLLATTFYFLGMVLFLKSATSAHRNYLYISCLFVVSMLGMASREDFSTFPVMLVLFDLFFVSRFDFKRVAGHYKIYLPVFLSLAYFAHLAINNTYDSNIDYPGEGIPPANFVLTQFNVHWTYLKMLIFPVNQNIDHDYSIAKTLLEFPTLLSFIGYGSLLFGSILFARRRPMISFSVLWFLVTLLPISFAVALLSLRLDDVVLEHRLYLPGAGFFIAAGAAMPMLAGKIKNRYHKIAAAAVLLLVLVLASVTHARNAVWQSSISIWKDAAMKSPDKARPHNNLGLSYSIAGMPDSAIEHYRIALEIKPGYVKALSNLGSAYQDKGLPEEAVKHLNAALELDPKSAEAHTSLGIAYNSLGLKDKALEHFEAAFKFSPHSPATINNLGYAYLSRGLNDKAAEHFAVSLKTMPGNAGAHNGLGIVEYRKGRIDKALEQFRYAATLDPQNADTHYNLGIAYRAMGLYVTAEEHMRIAERLSRKGH